MSNDIGAIFSSIGALLKAGNALLDVRDQVKLGALQQEFQTTLIKLQELILNSQEDKSALLDEVFKLKAVIAQHEKVKRYGDEYVRKEISVSKFAYVKESFTGSFQQAHKYCSNCFEKGIYSTLDVMLVNNEFILDCHECKQELNTGSFGFNSTK
jgi:hypothetical protein